MMDTSTTWPKVSIIILNFNGLEDTVDCLESLKKITYPNYEVIVVDNGSKVNEAEILKEMYRDYIHAIRNDRNYGFAGGNNIGIKRALDGRADYVLLLNNDTVVDESFLSELVKVCENDRRIGIVGPKVYFYDKPDVISSAGAKIDFYRGEFPPIGENEVDYGQYDKVRDVDYVSGCALMVKKEVVERVGFLDPRYFLYTEEVDYAVRVRKAGFNIVFVPKAKIWHKIGRSSDDLQKLYYRLRNKLFFARKNARKRELFIFAWYYLLILMPLMSGRLFLRKPVSTLRAVFKAMTWNMRA